ncbi:MAG: hypothetical protein A4E61_00710 [Syntrophorhabdus sp. PtaB.Bin184]|nr:MAG: hypothetical protein A4E61_00710 [Syntrophorhabdus sp. PtaB.Bin184]
MPKIIISKDSILAISVPEKRSRTTARLPTIPTHAPTPARNRMATKTCMVCERAQPTEAAVYTRKPSMSGFFRP